MKQKLLITPFDLEMFAVMGGEVTNTNQIKMGMIRNRRAHGEDKKVWSSYIQGRTKVMIEKGWIKLEYVKKFKEKSYFYSVTEAFTLTVEEHRFRLDLSRWDFIASTPATVLNGVIWSALGNQIWLEKHHAGI